jgi:hypothetical protein
MQFGYSRKQSKVELRSVLKKERERERRDAEICVE